MGFSNQQPIFKMIYKLANLMATACSRQLYVFAVMFTFQGYLQENEVKEMLTELMTYMFPQGYYYNDDVEFYTNMVKYKDSIPIFPKCLRKTTVLKF